MASTDEKKRTQEAPETDFTTRGGREEDPDPEEEEYWRHETKHSIS